MQLFVLTTPEIYKLMLHINEQYKYTEYTIATPMTVTSTFNIELETQEFESFLDTLCKNNISRVDFVQDIHRTNPGAWNEYNFVKSITIRVNNRELTQEFEYDLLTHLMSFSTKNYGK